MFYQPQELVLSESRPGRLDFPIEAAMWLQQFRSQNATLLLKLDVRVRAEAYFFLSIVAQELLF